MNESSKVRNEITQCAISHSRQIEIILHRASYSIQDVIASYIASLCDVDVADMLSICDKYSISHARWLLWYTLQKIDGDTYERIAEKTSIDHCKFSARAIGHGITMMTHMIETIPIWKYRWGIVNRLIKSFKESIDQEI